MKKFLCKIFNHKWIYKGTRTIRRIDFYKGKEKVTIDYYYCVRCKEGFDNYEQDEKYDISKPPYSIF